MRTSCAGPAPSPSAARRAMSSSGTSTRTFPFADVRRNASRDVASRSSVRRRGSCPWSSSSPRPTSAPATSSSITLWSSATRPVTAEPPIRQRHLLDVERAVRDRLVEQRQRVAHRAGRGASDDRERFRRRLHAFLGRDVDEMPEDLIDGVERELVVLRARADRRRDLERVGGGEHEHDVLGRLFERLEQRGLARCC